MNNTLARSWMVLASATLLISGLLAVAITGAKMPGIKEYVGNIEFIRWCLVIHVNLATLVWFTAVPVGLLHLATRAGGYSGRLAQAGFIIALLGLVLMMSVPPHQGEAILANYIPVLTHPRYYLGIGAYLIGMIINVLAPRLLTPAHWRDCLKWPGLNECRFGFLVGSAYLVFAVLTLSLAYGDLRKTDLITSLRFFEVGMWGGGHLIQHACVVFLVCTWVFMLSIREGRPLFSRSELFPVFAWLGVPLFFVPVLLHFDVLSSEYREGFSMLMRWGIAPPVFLFLGLAWRRIKLKRADLKNYYVVAVGLSAGLLVSGFFFGALIRGSDMRVPGHYHASIGAVTLAFMAIAYTVLARAYSRWILRSAWVYGLGQILFASGMFVAGSFGMPRKTYGSQHIFTHWGQSVGVGMMAVGGLIAMAGGIFFAVAVLPNLRLKSGSFAAVDEVQDPSLSKFGNRELCVNITKLHG